MYTLGIHERGFLKRPDAFLDNAASACGGVVDATRSRAQPSVVACREGGVLPWSEDVLDDFCSASWALRAIEPRASVLIMGAS
jgi:hypothetical protein